MQTLTVERLFSSPPLSGRLPTQLKFPPDGTYLAYLQAAEDDRERLDLWRLDLITGERGCWLDARTLTTRGVMSDAEKAERERRRLFASGITAFQISPSGERILLPAGGTGYLFDLRSETLEAFTPEGTRQTDFRFSPRGTYISFVRDGNLFCFDIEARQERAVTTEGGGPISCGIADFIAQEEMHRFDGHWWSDDETMIAYQRTDESTIDISHRYEIDADAFNVIEQRYPYAGADNARVDLLVYTLDSGHSETVNFRHQADDYLARVNWAGDRLLVQAQSRNQQRLSLDSHDVPAASRETLLEETSDTWINLHDNLRHLEDGRLLWTSERDGTARLYLFDSGMLTCLTPDHGRVTRLVHADGDHAWFTGWDSNPTEQHLYRASLNGVGVERETSAPGWHEPVLGDHGERADCWTSLDNPGEIRINAGGVETVLTGGNEPAHPYTPYLPVHITPQIGTLNAEDGQTLYYRLTRPRDAQAAPLIVYVYGGPGANRVRNEWAPLLLQIFAAHGMGVLELDNRGSANRDRRFEAPIYRRLGQAEVADQLVGARFAQTLDWVDGDRIGVFGHSYGGYMTLMCLAQAPEVFKAGVAVAPVSRWELYDTHYTERYLGTPADNPDGYRDSAVLPYLDRLQGRLLLMHGMADDNVLFTHSTMLFKALQDRHYPFEMMTYPGAKHSLQERDVSIHRFNLIMDFFRRALA